MYLYVQNSVKSHEHSINVPDSIKIAIYSLYIERLDCCKSMLDTLSEVINNSS